ncbi:hypothetical protein RHMOL_Rhmol08G0205700 [Rhododendron molle]|nr:hypothetical protein RHMOL_Rhmol08G0205700 [Rhododendron molle]
MQVKGSEIPFTSCHWLLLFTSYGGNVTPGFSRAGPGVLLRLLMKFLILFVPSSVLGVL